MPADAQPVPDDQAAAYLAGLTTAGAREGWRVGETVTIAIPGLTGDEPTLHVIDAATDIEVRSESRREIVMRLVPWDVMVESRAGPEMWVRGALAHVNPRDVVLQLEHENPPAGYGIELEERDDGAYMAFKVSKTQRGDDILTLAHDKVTRGVSPSYYDLPGGTEMQTRSGRRSRVVKKADLRAVSTTWRPTWEQSAVLAVRSLSQGEPVAEPIPAPATPDPTDRIVAAFEAFAERTAAQPNEFQTRMIERLEAIEERSRKDSIIVPGRTEPKKALLVDWASWALRKLSGESINPRELQERALEDIVTPDNPGQVPDAFVNDLRGLVNRRRPFLESTREITAPESGMSIVVPVISQHSTAAVQATQKTEIESTALKVTSESYDAITIAGGADVSIQMIKRATRSYIDLLISDLQAAYAANCDARAIATILAAGTTPGSANINPESLLIGEAWENSITAFGEAPDTIWLSAAGVSDFINAKDDGTNRPLYFNLNANITVGGGPGGNVSALRPVYVPALNGTSVDVMIGPSAGFVWAEDGSFQLQADNPTLAGRDIAIVGILFFIPRYPAAFTTYDLGS